MSKITGNKDGWHWNETNFWTKVIKENDFECWQWQGAHHPSGGLFGAYRIKNGALTTQMTQARRISHYIHFGESIAEFSLKHSCKNPNCVNPYHLEKHPNQRIGLKKNG